MNEKFCLDKRIALLLLFSVPAILMIFLSIALNSAPVQPNSKASEPMVNPAVKAGLKPTSMPIRGNCLMPMPIEASNTIDFYLREYSDFSEKRPLKVYSYDGNEFLFISQAPLPENPSLQPLLTIEESTLKSGTTYQFVALQGDNIDTRVDKSWLNFGTSCDFYEVSN